MPNIMHLARPLLLIKSKQVMTPCHSNSEAASIQKALLLDNNAKCNNAGVCICEEGKYFDGRKCLPLAGR